jgi:hypothetical protein
LRSKVIATERTPRPFSASEMKVAIVHYHLEPGGVTRVIENTLETLVSSEHDVEMVVLTGRKYAGDRIPQYQVVEGLDYATPNQAIDPSLLMERMKDAAINSLGSAPDLWHVHNHSLGKNPSLTKATAILAEKGEFILLHSHDFAEDGRPNNFKALENVYEHAYPSGARIHYAALNNRDRLFLDELFEDTSTEVHLLANPIQENGLAPIDETLKTSIPENLFLYPVRAVRRKNLGELALLAAAYPNRHFANSLEPTNPSFRPQFERWKAFAENSALPLTYGLGHLVDCSFPDMVASADAIVSTSVAEGFGLGFLEPWVFGKSLCGRNLPEITEDFSRQGVLLDNLYDRLELNLDLLQDPTTIFPRIEMSLANFFNDYGEKLPERAAQEAFDSIVRDDQVDFGRLDEPLQEELITAVLESEENRKSIRFQSSIEPLSSARIEQNATTVQRTYSMGAYGKKLIRIYENLINQPKEKIVFSKGRKLLNQFLSPTRLNLLRTN